LGKKAKGKEAAISRREVSLRPERGEEKKKFGSRNPEAAFPEPEKKKGKRTRKSKRGKNPVAMACENETAHAADHMKRGKKEGEKGGIKRKLKGKSG